MFRKTLFLILGTFSAFCFDEIFVEYTDGYQERIKIRVAHWKAETDVSPKKTVLMTLGRTEFIEMYQNVVKNFTYKGYDVFAYDKRGHGASTNPIVGKTEKTHIYDYTHYTEDLYHVVKDHPQIKQAENLYLLGYSLGGHIVARTLLTYRNDSDFQQKIKGCLLICPMMDIYTNAFPYYFAWLLAEIFCYLGYSEADCFGYKNYDEDRDTFQSNRITNDEKNYMDYKQARITHKDDKLRWAPTFGWLRATFRSIFYIQAMANFGYKISQPTLMITAENEVVVRNHRAKQFYDKCCANRKGHIELKGSYHQPMIETENIQKVFWEKVDGFLKEGSTNTGDDLD